MKSILFLTLGIILACATALAQQNVSDSLEHQGYQRKYIVHLPPSYTGNSPLPLVLTLHSGSGNNLSVQGFTQMKVLENQ